MKKSINRAEKTLCQIMAVLGPNGACGDCCSGCSHEMNEALSLVHKYFGKKRTLEIYKELDYVVRKGK